MLLKKFIVLQVLNILTATEIQSKNSLTTKNYRTLQTNEAFYLNSKRPLWILQDQKDKEVLVKNSLKEKVKYESVTPLKNHKRQQKQQQQQQKYSAVKLKTKTPTNSSHSEKHKGIQLPYNYIPFEKANKRSLATSSRRYLNSRFIGNLSVFDAAPGDDTPSKIRPIFIYTGNKGRMLLNTMLSKRKYPMQEPVPGQVLQPPPALIFKPKVLVEKLQQKLNVTMIPFYAYEAINPRVQSQQITTTASATSSTPDKHEKKYKKAKQYAAFYSPQEVLSQPTVDLSQYFHHIEHTTNSPQTLEKPFVNHRFENMTPTTTTTTATTPLPPHKKIAVTYNDGEDKFQITYEDDTAHLERPFNTQTTQFTTTMAPFPYESYTFATNYYAFPVYTMAKLLDNKEDSAQRLAEAKRNVTVEPQHMRKYSDAALKKENNSLINTQANEDTWFILNTRYKGPSKTNTRHLHSSKYIQFSPIRFQADVNLL